MWILFAALGPLFYSFTNIIEKFLVEKRIKNLYTIVIFNSLFLGIVGILLWIYLGFPVLPLKETIFALISGFLLALYILPYLYVLNFEEASRVIPLYQFISVFVLLLSYFFLNEVLTARQLLAAVLIICGGFLLSLFIPHIIKEDIAKSTVGIKFISITIMFVGLYLINT